MPWTCQACSTDVEADDTVCPHCEAPKTSWTMVAETTRTLKVTPGRRFKLMRGEGTEPVDPDNPDQAEDALSVTKVARVIERDVAQQIASEGKLPAPCDVLSVRLFPNGYEDLSLTLTVEYGADEDGTLEFPDAREASEDEAVESLDLRFLFVCGGSAPDGESLQFEGLEVVDLSEDTPEGYAPGVGFAALGKRPKALPVKPAESSARRLCLNLTGPGGAPPLAKQDYVISFDGGERSGTTDDGGVLREGLPEAIEEATLSVAGQTLTLLLDTLDPLEDESGVEAAQARLQNLGYELGNVDGDLAEKTRGALETFQADQGIGVTGVLDGPTRERLTLAHGC